MLLRDEQHEARELQQPLAGVGHSAVSGEGAPMGLVHLPEDVVRTEPLAAQRRPVDACRAAAPFFPRPSALPAGGWAGVGGSVGGRRVRHLRHRLPL